MINTLISKLGTEREREFEMERRNNIRLFVLMVMVLGLVARQSSAAGFGECYGPCFIFCLLKPNATVCTCTLECLKDCLIPSSLPSSSADNISSSALTDQYCNLGCAIFSCATLSSKTNPGVKEVANCVNSCSQTCTSKKN